MFKKIIRMFSRDNDNNKENKQFHILIVEDNEIDRKVVSKILLKQGYEITEAENGKEGLEIVKLKKPDLIILDCEMPELGGIDMCRQLKESVETSDVPVLFLTGHDTPQNIVKCFDVNAENIISKPVSPRSVLPQIKIILDGKTPRQN